MTFPQGEFQATLTGAMSNGEVTDMCTSFGFNCHPERPCQLEREWVSLWMRLFSYLRRKLRPSEIRAAQMVPPQNPEERKAFAAKIGAGQ